MAITVLEDETEVQRLPAMFAPGAVLLERYRVVDVLGMGGYGMVLRARDLTMGHEVALKILRSDIELDQENTQRFLREARAVVQLRSEHVVRIHDVGTLDVGSPYLVMELLDGEDLGSRLARKRRLAIADAAELVVQACDALAEAHSLGIVHRDLKPTNLFVTRRADGSDLLKVLDFGISKAPMLEGEVSLTRTASVLGTPVYMSPEQMRSARAVDGRSDVWSLGVVLYELVEGRLPFKAASFAELVLLVASEAPPPLTRAPQLSRLIARCLAKDPADRYANVGELAADLAGFIVTPAIGARVARIQRVLGATAKPRPRARSRRGRNPRAIAALAAGVVFAGAAVLGVVTRADKTPPPQPASLVPRVEPAPAAQPIAVPAELTPQPEPATFDEQPPPSLALPEPEATPPPAPTPAPAPATVVKKPAPPRKVEPPAGSATIAAPKCDPFATVKGC